MEVGYQPNLKRRLRGSGASGDFGPEQARWRTEDRQAAKHKCLISSRFPSLTRVTGEHLRPITASCPQMHQNPIYELPASGKPAGFKGNASTDPQLAYTTSDPGYSS